MPIRTAINDRIAEIVFDHPPVNALDSAGWNELPAIITTSRATPRCACLLVRGEGKGFCGGVDIKEMQAHPERIVELNRGNYLTFKAVRSAEVPVVTAVHGFVIGGGIGICGASDVIIAAEDAYFSLPEVDRGAMGGASHLLRMLPVHKVRAAFFTAGRISRGGSVPRSVPSSASCRATSCSTRRARSPPRSPPRAAGHSCWPRKRSTVSSRATSTMAIVSSRASRSRCTCIRIRRRRATRSSSTRARRSTETQRAVAIDLHYTPAQNAFRAEVRAWMAAHVPADAARDARRRGRLRTAPCLGAHARDRQLGLVTWPRAYGGRGADLIEWLIFEEEYYRAGAPLRVNQNGIFLLGPTLMEFGTAEQKARFLPKMAAGEEIWAQGWSEPQAGSDLAAIRATGDARRRRLRAARAQDLVVARGVCRLVLRPLPHRSGSPSATSGLTFFLRAARRPGVTRASASAQLDGEPGFAEIFFDDARVPVANRLGAEGEGWNVAMATAGFERGLMLRSPGRFQAAAQRLRRALPAPCATKPTRRSRDAVAQAWMDAEAYALNTYLTATPPHGGRLDRRRGEPQQDLLVGARRAPASRRDEPARRARRAAARRAGARRRRRVARRASCSRSPGPIYAGTNEIQRNIIAERLLGLPRGG